MSYLYRDSLITTGTPRGAEMTGILEQVGKPCRAEEAGIFGQSYASCMQSYIQQFLDNIP